MSLTSRTRRAGTFAAAAITLGLAAGALTACSSDASATGDDDGSLSIALLAFDTTNPWVATLVSGAESKADELDIDLTVSNANYDNAAQIAQVQDAVAKGVDAIIIQAADADGIVPAVNQATEAGIAVFAVNANVGDGAEVVSFVGADQSQMGVGAAELVKEAVPDGGAVALIQGAVGNPISTVRTEGFTETLGEWPEYEIVATVTDNFTSDENLAVVQDLLAKYPAGQLDAIVAQGGQLYVGAEYAASIGRDDVAFIANDYPIQVRDAIVAGQIFGTVNQDGALQGSSAVEAAFNWLTGNQDAVQRPTQYIDLPLVTQDNVADFDTTWRS
ncbi:sugar ABC transporter substrate-binding protein [Microbacterium allomyrinae]|uniref:Sugar ABC transporter substrate-binding protein n=1 Tax=Microbacterium allomyrinae TaxID=2830666 RepID=A0A9X1LSW5_9MICO|nr:sugar ABC transporter substrate-binding protein [Microbacterium allomyrinae]MCC2031552.1 sugar ABC transporter substrate-binding protein [Microbacterium allomyrinae]